MIGWLWRTVFGSFCLHKWKLAEMTELHTARDATGRRVYLECTKCGDWKKRDLA